MLRPSLSTPLTLLAALLLPATSLFADIFYVPDATGDRVVKVNQAGAQTTVASLELMTPEQATYDAAGDLYVADSGLGQVLKFPAAGGVPTPVGDAVAGVCALAFDAGGVLHVLNPTDDTVRKLNGGTFVIVATLAGNPTPRSLAFDPDGNIYVTDSTGNRVLMVTPAGGQDVYSDDVIAPYAVAIDQAGKIYVTDTDDGGRITGFNPNGKSNTLIDGLGQPRGLAFDRGNIPYYLTATGELRKVIGRTETDKVAESLGDVRLLTSRGPQTRVIAVKGQSAPEPESSALFASFSSPAIGGGTVAFRANLLPPSGGVASSNAQGIWRTLPDFTLERVARKSFPLPGTTDLIVNSMGDPVINESGEIAFLGTLKSGIGEVTSANANGVFSDCGGFPLRAVVRKGDPAPGANLDPAVKFTAFKQVVLPNDAGPAVIATIAGPGVNSGSNIGLWSSDPAGTLSLVVRKGDMITVADTSRKLTSFNLFVPSPTSLGQTRHFGDSGQFTFLAKFSDGFTAILRVKSGMDPIFVAEKLGDVGDAIPGAKFASFYTPAMSADGTDVAFNSKLVPNLGGITTSSALAMIYQFGGTNAVPAQASFDAAGVQDAILSKFSDPVVAANGNYAFSGKMKPGLGGVLTSTAAAIWQDVGNGLQLAVRQSDVAPGVPKLPLFTSFKQIALPPTGGVVFTATIAGPDVTSANNFGLWANDGAGGTELLLRKGDKLVLNDVERTVSKITVFTALPGVSGQTRHFDLDGRIVCAVTCTDKTQAIVMFVRP